MIWSSKNFNKKIPKKPKKLYINNNNINWSSLWYCITIDWRGFKVLKSLLNSLIGLCIIFLDVWNQKNVDWWMAPLFTWIDKHKNPIEWFFFWKELYRAFVDLDVVIDLTTLHGWFIFYIGVFFSLLNFWRIVETSFLVCWHIKFENTLTEEYLNKAFYFLHYFVVDICCWLIIIIIFLICCGIL